MQSKTMTRSLNYSNMQSVKEPLNRSFNRNRIGPHFQQQSRKSLAWNPFMYSDWWFEIVGIQVCIWPELGYGFGRAGVGRGRKSRSWGGDMPLQFFLEPGSDNCIVCIWRWTNTIQSRTHIHCLYSNEKTVIVFSQVRNSSDILYLWRTG